MSRKISKELSEHIIALQHLIEKYPKMIARYVNWMEKDGEITELEKNIFMSKHGMVGPEFKPMNFSMISCCLNRLNKNLTEQEVITTYNTAVIKIVKDMVKSPHEKLMENLSNTKNL